MFFTVALYTGLASLGKMLTTLMENRGNVENADIVLFEELVETLCKLVPYAGMASVAE